MRFHFVMLLIVALVSLGMHGMASAAPRAPVDPVQAGLGAGALPPESWAERQ